MTPGMPVIVLRDSDGDAGMEHLVGRTLIVRRVEKACNFVGKGRRMPGALCVLTPADKKAGVGISGHSDGRWFALVDLVPADAGIAALYGFDVKEGGP